MVAQMVRNLLLVFTLKLFIFSLILFVISLISFMFNLILCIFSLILFVFSQILHIFSLDLFVFSQILYILSHFICIQSDFTYIQSRLICIQSHLINIQFHLICIQSHLIYIQSRFIQSSFLYSVSHTVWQDIVPQILSCSRFGNNQIELRKRQIQKYKNMENRILNSNKNIVEKTETWKTLEELHSLQFHILYRWHSQTS